MERTETLEIMIDAQADWEYRYWADNQESMASEWSAIQQFPLATQTKLLELLTKLKEKAGKSMTILVMGKGGVGKTSTVNSILGERAIEIMAFPSDVPGPVMVSRKLLDFTLNIIDTPRFVEKGRVNNHALKRIKRFLLDKTIDVLLYVDRLDLYGVIRSDTQAVVKAITESFGKKIWGKGVVVLTHAQHTPLDSVTYDEFFARRSEAVLEVVLQNSGESLEHPIPVVMVENSIECKTNEDGEKILPNGTVWIPNVVEAITNVATNENKRILIARKPPIMIDRPNANERWKMFIPVILACQHFVIKQIHKWIKDDINKDPKSSRE